MALPPLATVAELEAAMQRPAGSLTAEYAELAIRRASARVRRYTRQDITLVADDTLELPGLGRVLQLPQRPVVVDETHTLTVVELGELSGIEVPAVEGQDFTRLGAELSRGYPWYSTSRLGGWPWHRALGVWAPRVRVTYSHGYAEVPDDILDVVLDLASMNLTNPENLRSESVGGESFTYASETIGNATLSPGHKELLDDYRRTAFSVTPS